MSRIHAPFSAAAMALALACAQPAFGQSSTTPPGGPLTPALMPDLVIVMAAVSVKCIDGKKVNAAITATMQNKGAVGTADFSKITWQIGVGAKWWAVPGNALSLVPG